MTEENTAKIEMIKKTLAKLRQDPVAFAERIKQLEELLAATEKAQ